MKPADHILFVVSRAKPGRVEWLQSTFARQAGVEVVLDRRWRERRQRSAPVSAERRRRGDRRVFNITYELEGLGYALIRRSP